MIKFSVIIPVYNRAMYIEETVKSVLSRPDKNREVICVDDGSQDDSLSRLYQLAKTDSRIKVVVHKKNAGTHIARKTGVAHASGNYILFLDCDDKMDENAFAILEKNLQEKEADVLAFAFKSKKTKYTPLAPNDYTYENIILQPTVCNKGYKAAVLKKAFSEMQNFYGVFYEDLYESLVIKYYVKKYDCISNTLMFYNTESGITHKKKCAQNFGRDMQSLKSVSENIKLFFTKKNIYRQEFFDRLEQYLINHAYYFEILLTVKRSEWKKCFTLLPDYFSGKALAPYRKKITGSLFHACIDYCFIKTAQTVKVIFPRSFINKVKKAFIQK